MYVVAKPFNSLNRRFRIDDPISATDIVEGSAMSFQAAKDRGFVKSKRIDYDAMTRHDLETIAAERGVDVSGAKTKADVVAAIEYTDKTTEATQTGVYDALTKHDLERLATERGLDISGAKTKADLISLLETSAPPVAAAVEPPTQVI
jgi:3-oxoacyl-ACP reductase-like protein